MSIKDKIRTVPHWPIEGVMFRDITTLLQDPEGLRESCDAFYNRYKDMQIDKIILPKSLLTKLVKHAKKSSPNESVAMISGKIKGTVAYAEKVYTPENIDKSTTTFTVDPLTLLKIYTEIEEEGKELVAIYHTHPAPPKPSGTDKSYMEVNPCVWLISTTKKPEEPKGYQLEENDTIKEVEVTILN